MSKHPVFTEEYYDILDYKWVQACKSLTPISALINIAETDYLNVNGNYFQLLSSKLSAICTKYNLITITKLLDNINPQNKWKYVDGDATYYEFITRVLCSTIRLSLVDDITGYRQWVESLPEPD